MNEGKKDRRDPIRTIKARNPVAKNATSAIGGGAAGAHKDKKKAAKQGEVKHKKAEFAESYEDHLKQILKTKLLESQTFIIHFADMDTDETDTASVIAPDINTARKIFSRENPELYIERIRPAGTQFARHDFGDETDEGFMSDLKQSWNKGMADAYQKKLRNRINPAYHKLYNIDSVKTRDDAIALGRKAKAAGHLVDQGVAEETRKAELDRKFNTPAQLKKDADYRAYRAGVNASRKQPPAPLPVKEDWIDDNAAEPLARYFADLYYGDFSATEKVKLTAYIYQSIQDGKLSIDQLKADIDMLEKEKGIKEQGVAEADETSWTANSAQFRKEEDISWPVEITLEPNADINQGRGRQVKTMTVTGQSRDAAKKKLVDYFLKNGWTVTGIKFTGDLDEQGVAEVFAPVSALPQQKPRKLTPDQQKKADRDVKLLGKYHEKGLSLGGAINRFNKYKEKHQNEEQGVAEDVSRLSDSEYNRVAAYVRKKYPGTQLSGLGRNKDGSFNVMIDSGSGRHEFKVRFRDPEETKLDELSPDTLKSYIKKSKGHSQKYDQKGNKADEKGDEKLANKMWNKGDNRYAGAEQARVKLADLKDKKKGVAEGGQQYTKFRVGQRATFQSSNGVEFPVIITAVDYDDEAVKFKHANNKPFPNGELEQEVDPGWRFLTPDRSYDPNSLVKATSRESRVGEEFDSPEYNDEAGMARSNLLTLARAVKGLFDTIEKDDNLPEWAQEKIAKAEMMLVSVWDYMLSQKAQGIDPEINELNKSTLGSYVKKASSDLADRVSGSSFRSGAAGDKYNKADPSRQEKSREKGIGRAVDKLAKEGWTHDSLADRLFEHERTYEEQLQNKLNRKLGK